MQYLFIRWKGCNIRAQRSLKKVGGSLVRDARVKPGIYIAASVEKHVKFIFASVEMRVNYTRGVSVPNLSSGS